MKFLKVVFTFLILIIWSKTYASNYYDDYKRYDKVIRVNTFALKLSYYEKWKKIWTFDISTGDEKHPTPHGRFKLRTKSESMISKSAWKFMPYWMEFSWGIYWIHALPEDSNWNLDTKSVIWVEWAWWCVRLNKIDAQKLYKWADNTWTYILIDYSKLEYSSIDDQNIIKKYIKYINEWKYKEAYNLKADMRVSFKDFKKIYEWLNIKILSIEKKEWDFIVKTEIYREKKLIKRSTSVFQISSWKIMKSYLVKK